MLAMIACVVLAWLLFWPIGGRVDHTPVAPRAAETHALGRLETVYFDSHGTQLEAWLFTPHASTRRVLVMASGLTSTKDCLLEPFAWNAVSCGYAVLVFDFRTLGGSSGYPRHYVDPLRQVEDFGAAITFAAQRFDQLVLWGSSFSGGEAIIAATQHAEKVAGVIAQVPYLEAAPHLEPRGLRLLRFIALASLDLARAAISPRLPAVYVRAFGRPGEFAFYVSRENPSATCDDGRDPRAHAFWQALPNPIRGGWSNVMAARMLARLDQHRPLEALPRLVCPLLLLGAAQDDAILPAQLERAAALLPAGQVTLHVFDCPHYAVYLAPVLEQNLKLQAKFLRDLG
jgi:pimeloyl-ACP methyl ester carboxylesterase